MGAHPNGLPSAVARDLLGRRWKSLGLGDLDLGARRSSCDHRPEQGERSPDRGFSLPSALGEVSAFSAERPRAADGGPTRPSTPPAPYEVTLVSKAATEWTPILPSSGEVPRQRRGPQPRSSDPTSTAEQLIPGLGLPPAFLGHPRMTGQARRCVHSVAAKLGRE